MAVNLEFPRTSVVNSRFISKILDMESTRSRIQGFYKEILRALENIFGSLSYIDGNNNIKEIKCFHGNPERVIAKLKQESTIILPLISITKIKSNNSDERRRYTPILMHDKYWSHKKQRAVRIISLSPRPVTVEYAINIWSKFREDMDQIEEQIFAFFNPDLLIPTSFSTSNKAFLIDEEDKSELIVVDTSDRLLKKSILIEVQGYINNPKFRVTDTGKIEEFHVETEVS